MSQRFVLPLAQPLDTNGAVMAGAKLYFYETGTTTPLDTYSDSGLSVANANPVVADANGLFDDIFLLSQNYKVILKTSADVTLWTADPVSTGSSVVDDTSPQLGGTLDTNSHQIRWSKGADVASANALTLGTDGNYFDITGTTAITSIATLSPGTVVKLHFDGALTLTHHSTDLIIPGGANITTAAGDEAEFVEYATGDWRCTNYSKASIGVNLVESDKTANLTAGFTTDEYAHGEITTGTVTVSLTVEPVQTLTANGAFTLDPPASGAGHAEIWVTNGASAGAITTSGFTQVTGDTYATTNAKKYLFQIARSSVGSVLNVVEVA